MGDERIASATQQQQQQQQMLNTTTATTNTITTTKQFVEKKSNGTATTTTIMMKKMMSSSSNNNNASNNKNGTSDGSNNGNGNHDTYDALATPKEEEKATLNNITEGSGSGGVLAAAAAAAATPTTVTKPSGGGGASAFWTEITAFQSTERHASEYNMNHKYRGQALIFNHEKFDIPDLDPRSGTDVDCAKLAAALKNLEFDVRVHNDCKLRDIKEITQEAAESDHSENDCFLLAILTHGEMGHLFAKDCSYKLDMLTHYFTAHICPTLAGKPKLFFIQACQGDRLDPGVLLQKRQTETDSNASSSVGYRIPLHADFLIAYSTIQGFYSWRNPQEGSWFIQSLVKELEANGKKQDLLTMLTFVIQSVAINYESKVPHSSVLNCQKQIPCVTTMLTRLLRFKEKKSKELLDAN